jgi:hypothetical protein
VRLAINESKGVKAFWVVVYCLAIVAMFMIGIFVSTMRGVSLTLSERLVFYAAGGILVGVVWAILFRTQIEKLRLSLFVLFILLSMEALWLAAIRIINPFWSV